MIFENPARKPTSARDLHSFVQTWDISVSSSSLVLELLTRFDTGHLFNTSSARWLLQSRSLIDTALHPCIELLTFQKNGHAVMDFGNKGVDPVNKLLLFAGCRAKHDPTISSFSRLYGFGSSWTMSIATILVP